MKNFLLFISILITLSGFSQKSNLDITHLSGNFYIYKTFNLFKGDRISANGMYLVTEKGVALFDTPWDTTQFQPLLDSIKAKHHKDVVLCIATHFHEDRTAGLEYYRSKGIATYTTAMTDSLSKLKGKKRAEFLIDNDTTFRIGSYSFQTYYPGEGHAPDNIVIWFKKEKILYGGCLIKSTEDGGLGNLSDANTFEYAHTVKNVMSECKNPRYVIPGHNDWKNNRSVGWTFMMAEDLLPPPVFGVYYHSGFPMVNEKGELNSFDKTIPIFYLHGAVIMFLPYTVDSFQNTYYKNLDSVSEKLLGSDTRYYYFVYEKGNTKGLWYRTIKDITPKTLDIDSLYYRNSMPAYFEKMILMASDSLIVSKKEGGIITEKYFVRNKPDESYNDTTFLYYSDKMKDIPFSFSPLLDSSSHSKLFRIILRYNSSFNKQYSVTMPQRDLVFEITPIREVNDKLLNTLRDRYMKDKKLVK